MLYLVGEELTEVLHIHLVSLSIDDCREAAELDLVILEILHCDDNIGEFADSRRLDKDPLRVILLDYLVERLAEIADERAADAARDHLVDLDARFSQESGVDSDLAEFIFNQYDILCFIAFCYELLDKCCFSCSEKTGEDVYFCHFIPFCPAAFCAGNQ